MMEFFPVLHPIENFIKRRCQLSLLLFIPIIGCQQKEFDVYAVLRYTAGDMQE